MNEITLIIPAQDEVNVQLMPGDQATITVLEDEVVVQADHVYTGSATPEWSTINW